MDPAEFLHFFRALCRGESWAEEELVRRYRPFLREIIQRWLADARLSHVADSSDLCQIIFPRFLACLKQGRYQDLKTHQELEKFLSHMAKNAFHDLRRQERRGGGPAPPTDDTPEPADSASSPSQHAAREELEQLFLARLSPQARQIHAWRADGCSWVRIGAALNLAPNTARIRFQRECERVAGELGLQSRGES